MSVINRRAAMVGAFTSSLAAAPSVEAEARDPIIGAIERYNAPYRASSEFLAKHDLPGQDAADQPGLEAPDQAEWRTGTECFATVPMTVAGCAAKARHLSNELSMFAADARHIGAIAALAEGLERLVGVAAGRSL